MRLTLLLAALLTPTVALSQNFQRPIPQAQTAQAELSYLIAALLMLFALVCVQWLISRR